jgi:hypothetical protein
MALFALSKHFQPIEGWQKTAYSRMCLTQNKGLTRSWVGHGGFKGFIKASSILFAEILANTDYPLPPTPFP